MSQASLEAQEPRRRELSCMTKYELAEMCRKGIKTPDGRLVTITGVAAPVVEWGKEEIVQTILDAEFRPV